jgi:hypothetical protein
VGAKDPLGSALSFSWTASKGTLGSANSGSSLSIVDWTAPACAAPDTPPRITATVTNTFGLTATHSFTVTGLPACSLVWITTGLMGETREAHEATLLPNGKVLVAGGVTVNAPTWTTAVYNPAGIRAQ